MTAKESLDELMRKLPASYRLIQGKVSTNDGSTLIVIPDEKKEFEYFQFDYINDEYNDYIKLFKRGWKVRLIYGEEDVYVVYPEEVFE